MSLELLSSLAEGEMTAPLEITKRMTLMEILS